MKATGTGIGHDLQAVEFKINTKETSPQVGYYNTVGPLLSGHLLTATRQLSGHFPKSRIIILSVKCCIQYLYSTANLY